MNTINETTSTGANFTIPTGVNFSNKFDETKILEAIEYALDYDTMPLGINEAGHRLELDLIKEQVIDYLRSI